MSNRPIFRPVDYVLSDSGVVDDFSLEFSRGFEHREILTCQETFRTFERGGILRDDASGVVAFNQVIPR